MAFNYIKCVQNHKSIEVMRHLRPFVSKRFLSTDKLTTDVKTFDHKIETQMKEKVLDKRTHTGQTFTADDYRLTRFLGKSKEINPRFAIDLIAETPPIAAKDHWISCDGGGGPLGHPKVFINLDDPGEYGTCGYCGLRFYKEGHQPHH